MTHQLIQANEVYVGRTVEGEPFHDAAFAFNKAIEGATLVTWRHQELVEGLLPLSGVENKAAVINEAIDTISLSSTIEATPYDFFIARPKQAGRPHKYNIRLERHSIGSTSIYTEMARIRFITRQRERPNALPLYLGLGRLMVQDAQEMLCSIGDAERVFRERLPRSITFGPLHVLE